jgi:hypothetical protein
VRGRDCGLLAFLKCRLGLVIIRTKDLAFGVDPLEPDLELGPDLDPPDAPEEVPVDTEATVEVGELTTIISDPKLGKDWKLSADSIASTAASASASASNSTAEFGPTSASASMLIVRGGAIGICLLISSSDMEATGTITGVFKV